MPLSQGPVRTGQWGGQVAPTTWCLSQPFVRPHISDQGSRGLGVFLCRFSLLACAEPR